MTSVRLDHISKRFDQTVALDDINLRIEAGELFFLLGPSGCGKSTLLRLIAGLHEPGAGSVWFNDRDVTRLGTEVRNAVMCFQSYALWPHMSVLENVRFGLNVRGVGKDEQLGRVHEVLKLVQLDALAERKPNQLSGGQQQRVALARALAVNPDCLLLDEPLSNLDAKLRHEMRSEIRRICKESGFTTIYVTHDQKEALSVADRIAVLRAGKLVQVGTPAELYHRPATSFVADFIGQTNLIEGTVAGRDGEHLRVRTAVGIILATGGGAIGDVGADSRVIVSVRPEMISLSRAPRPGVNQLAGAVVETTFLGETSEHVIDVNGQRIKLICAPPRFGLEGNVNLEFSPDDAVVLPE